MASPARCGQPPSTILDDNQLGAIVEVGDAASISRDGLLPWRGVGLSHVAPTLLSYETNPPLDRWALLEGDLD